MPAVARRLTPARWLCFVLLLTSFAARCGPQEVVVMTSNPTAMGRWAELWEKMVPESTLLPFTNT